jgi:hypothetical protein
LKGRGERERDAWKKEKGERGQFWEKELVQGFFFFLGLPLSVRERGVYIF